MLLYQNTGQHFHIYYSLENWNMALFCSSSSLHYCNICFVQNNRFYLNNFFYFCFFFQYLFFLLIIDQCKTNRNYETVTVPLFPKLISKTDGNEQRKKNRKTWWISLGNKQKMNFKWLTIIGMTADKLTKSPNEEWHWDNL